MRRLFDAYGSVENSSIATSSNFSGEPDTEEQPKPKKRGRKPKAKSESKADGKCDAADAVLLHKWLLAKPDTALADWDAGDLNINGKLDTGDLSKLKMLILSGK